MKQTNEIPISNSDIKTLETNSTKQTLNSTATDTQTKTTTAQINAKLWDACNTFRGLMDGSDYKDYILTMLFIKYLSDTYTEKTTELKAKSCGIDSVYKALLNQLDFKLEAHSTFAYLQEHKNATNLGELSTPP